jgi:hypothetical protein
MNTTQQAQQYRIEWVSLLTGETGYGDWITSKELIIDWVTTQNVKWEGVAHHTYVPRYYGGAAIEEDLSNKIDFQLTG